MFKFRTMLFLFFLLIQIPRSYAVPVFTPGNVSQLTNDAVSSLVKTVAIGADHHAYMPASALGAVVGFDIGLDITAISIPSSFQSAMALAGVTGKVPSVLPLPKLNIHKGLPLRLDAGFTYFGYQNYKIIGGELKWNFYRGSFALPAFAVRASETISTLFFMKTHTYTLDLVASKRLFYLFEPYIGVGWQWAQGNLDVPISGPLGLSLTVSSSNKLNKPHAYVGFPIKILLIRITPEYQYSAAGVQTYGVKFSLNI